MPAKSYENEHPKDGFPTCQCGKGMSDCSIHPNTREEWIASMQDSLARTLASLESSPGLEKALAAGFTEKSCVLLASLSPDTSSWKTCQLSLLTDSEPSLQTWPRWGMTAGGAAYEHPMSALRMDAIDGGLEQNWPTPSATDYKGSGKTGTLRDRLDYAVERGATKSKDYEENLSGGKLNPMWVEWLMMWPIGWTDSKHWVTVKFRYKRRQRGGC
jgi:hypothetical protein